MAMCTVSSVDGSFSTADIGTINRTGGTVNITGIVDNSLDTLTFDGSTGTWILDGGTINGGTIQFNGANILDINDNINNFLDGVTLRGDLTLSDGNLIIRNGLVLRTEDGLSNGTLTFSSSITTGIRITAVAMAFRFFRQPQEGASSNLTIKSTTLAQGRTIEICAPPLENQLN